MKLGTYNCLSLGPQVDQEAKYQGVTGQVPLLRHLADELGFQILALQECRTEQGMIRSATHLRFCSGHDDNGLLGVELWINLQKPFARQANGTPIYFGLQYFSVIHAEPRILIVRLSMPEFPVILVIGHALHEGHGKDAVQLWWDHLRSLLDPFKNEEQIHFLDANARISGSETAHFGTLTEDPPRKDSRCLRAHAEFFHLLAPSTFELWHHGQLHTWVHPNGKSTSRLGYILVPVHWQSGIQDSFVETELHVPRAYQDHSCAALRLDWWAKVAGRKTKRKGFDMDAMTTEEGKQKIAEIWDSLPLVEWTENATLHAQAPWQNTFHDKKGCAPAPWLHKRLWIAFIQWPTRNARFALTNTWLHTCICVSGLTIGRG